MCIDEFAVYFWVWWKACLCTNYGRWQHKKGHHVNVLERHKWHTNMLYEGLITVVKGVVEYTTIYVISTHHNWHCEFESHSGAEYSIQHLCDNVCQWLVTGRWFSLGT